MDFERLVDRYEKPIFNLAYRLLGDRDDAADLTQETFVSAYRSYGQFRGDSAVYTWLYRIAINLCKNKFKLNDRIKQYEGPSLDSDGGCEDGRDLGEKLGHDDTPEAALQRKELRLRIEQAIMQLPPDYRIVAVLRDLQNLSYQEIADAADLSVDVVKTRLARARAMLRQKLESYLFE